MYSTRVADAKSIDRLICDLNQRTGLVFHVVQVLQHKSTHTDVFAFESKYRYTQALRLIKNDAGKLVTAKCLNFKPEVRFERPSIPSVLGDTARAMATPELVGRRNLRLGESIEPVVSETDFGLAPAKPVVRAYTNMSQQIAQDPKTYSKAFNALF